MRGDDSGSGQVKKSIKIPGIGFRIIKSAIAIFLCFLINDLRNGAGIVFYSQLSALWCMQVYRTNTKKNAIQRTIGTFIGAGFGLLFLLINQQLKKGSFYFDLLPQVCISLLIILVLYTTVLIKKKHASYFSCVVFLSIVVNHIGDANPYLFVWNRFLDTLIGIIVGVLVNDFVLPAKKDRDTLFVSTMDDTLLKKDEKLSDYSKAELNRLIEDGLKFTVATMRTPAIIMENLGDINFQYPVIAMDGAALYDTKNRTYPRKYVISAESAVEIRRVIEEVTPFYFTNIIIDDTLLIYYQEDMDGVMKKVVEDLRYSPYRNYIMRPAPKDESVVYYMILEKKSVQNELYNKLVRGGYNEKYKIVMYDSDTYQGCSYIKIFNKNATMKNMMEYLMNSESIKEKITIGTIEGKYDVIVSGKDANEAVKGIKSLYETSLFARKDGKEK